MAFSPRRLMRGASGAGGYQISRSLRFNSADSAYLNRTPASAGNRQIFTWSGWIKRSALGSAFYGIFGASTGANTYTGYWLRNDNLWLYSYTNGTENYSFQTTQLFRDPSAWYHLVIATDTTQATNTNRIKIYVNGSQVTALTVNTYPTQNFNDYIDNNIAHTLGWTDGGTGYYNGYMTEVNFIDGQQLTPSSFGETNAQTGVWQPKRYSGSYGTNGFYLNFSDNSNTTAATLGKDYSGNGNNWTPNNFSVTAGVGNDSLVDSPTSYGTDTGVGGTVRGNYATWNPLAKGGSFTNAPTNGNLDIISATTPNYGTALATMGMISGKWYWEVTNNAGTAAQSIGLAKDGVNLDSFLGSNTFGWTYLITGQTQTNGTSASYGASYTTNDIIGVAFDADAGTLVFYKNGTSQGTAFSGLTSGYYYPAVGDDSGANQASYTINFGQRPFAYTAPSGFKALCTQNLPTPTIGATAATQANLYFNPALWTGDNTTNRNIAVGFEPDLVWTKGRNTASWSHFLQDRLRGFVNFIQSSSTAAETTTTPSIVSGTYSSGFTIQNNGNSNNNGDTYVAWNWKANGSGSSNTSGSITSTVSANTTSGFSVVTYTGTGAVGATVGHGLGVAPSMIIQKPRSSGTNDDNWHVYHSSIGATGAVFLNNTAATSTSNVWWNNVAPTSSVFTVGGSANSGYTNYNTATYVAYCFAPIAGYSAFGSYTGNGSSSGPFVFTNMRPAYLLVKRTDAANGDWTVWDNKRNTYNPEANTLSPNQSAAEYVSAASNGIDFVSNGFRVVGTDSGINASGGTYIYACFAENPFKYSLAR
jgi:hypothetical protein